MHAGFAVPKVHRVVLPVAQLMGKGIEVMFSPSGATHTHTLALRGTQSERSGWDRGTSCRMSWLCRWRAKKCFGDRWTRLTKTKKSGYQYQSGEKSYGRKR